MKKENIILILSSCNKIIDIFLGPFLISYFIKLSPDTIIDLSIFKILNYAFLGLLGLFVGYIVKKGHPLATFRIGVISRFIYLLVIIVLNKNITNHLALLSFIYGFGTINFFIPYNIYRAECTENKRRTLFETKIKIINSIIGVAVPTILGTLISVTNYQTTIYIILIFSFIEIICSFYLKPLNTSNTNYKLTSAFKTFFENKDIKKLLIIDYFNGLTISEGVISSLITILIIDTFKTDFNLGIINTLATILSIIIVYLYSKFYKNSKNIIYLSIIVPIVSVCLLTIFPSPLTVLIETFSYEIFITNLLALILNVKIFNAGKTLIDDDYKVEYWVIREFILNLGRCSGYILMLLIGIIGTPLLKPILILVTSFLIIIGIIINRAEKEVE